MKVANSILNHCKVSINACDQSSYCVTIYTWKADSVELANNLQMAQSTHPGQMVTFSPDHRVTGSNEGNWIIQFMLLKIATMDLE